MLIGEYRHAVDAKKRLSIPAKFRHEIGTKAVLARSLDTSLALYPIAEWNVLAEKLSKLSQGQAGTRGFVRFMLAGAEEVDIDSLGRILIPEHLKTYAHIESSVVIIGVSNRLEIWDEKMWDAYEKEASSNVQNIAERLGELGIY